MNYELVLATVQEATKGANIKCGWHRICETLKSCPDVISKAVLQVGRVGVDYDHLKAVQEKRENGELPEQSQPIWHGAGEWAIFPYLIRHIKKNQYYLRLYDGTGTAKPVVQFFRNGKPVSKESVLRDLTAKEKRVKSGDCFCCKIEDMTEISWEPATPKVDREPVRETVETPEAVEA